MMVLRTAILGAMVVCTASLAMADQVVYCTDTAVNGFKWDNAGNAHPGRYEGARFTVKVISDTQRTIAYMAGEGAGQPLWYTCEHGLLGDQLVCLDRGGQAPWVFYKNNYTRAFLGGPPAGPPNSMDQDIVIAYGACTDF
jgi:hypothetical protein